MTDGRMIKFREAILEGLQLSMERDPRVYTMGLGVPDPKGTFGTTVGLQDQFGEDRVLDMPTSESAMTGVAIGSALVGQRPVMSHQRVEFALLAVEQMVNQAAKWRYMFGGQSSVPLVIRLIIGRGWGQGPQHSQCLHSWFAHIPGLKVLLPVTPHDAKGLLVSAIEDDDPVLIFEHRWLHETHGPVPEGHYRVPIGEPRLARAGKDLTIVACSYMVLEALRAAEVLAESGIDVEIIDLRSLAPRNDGPILESVSKTGRLLVADIGWKGFGVAGEIVACVAERAHHVLRAAPRRLAQVDCPLPTSRSLANLCYPGAKDVIANVLDLLSLPEDTVTLPEGFEPEHLDVPNPSFRGPF